MSLSRIELLAQAIISQTTIFDAQNEPAMKEGETYLPHYLRFPVAKADRQRVRRNITQLFELLRRLGADPRFAMRLPKDVKYENVTARALCAILYAERRPMPLFEYAALAQLESRLRHDVPMGFFQALGWKGTECQRWLRRVIEFHKIAALALGGRLRKTVFDEVCDSGTEEDPDFRLVIALVAAAAYDTPAEDQDSARFTRVVEIFRLWAGIGTKYKEIIPVTDAALKAETDKLIIPYDLPLCDYSAQDLSRAGFRGPALEHFLRLWLETVNKPHSPYPWLFATFHYDQAKLLAHGLTNRTISDDFQRGNDLNQRYEFVPYVFPLELGPHMPPVLELRLKEGKAFSLLLGTEDTHEPLSPGRAWEGVLVGLSTPTPAEVGDDTVHVYPTPLKSYIALPILHRLHCCPN